MTHAIIVLGSARKGRVADAVLTHILQEVDSYESITTTVVDLAELNLPFFNNEHAPSDPNYTPTDERVIAWSKLVQESDAVVFVTPEYNHTLSAIQKNAIDSLFTEWNNKPTAIVSYGWAGGSRSNATLKEIATVVKMDIKENPAELYFTKDISVDGSVIDQEAVTRKIRTTLDTIAAS